MVLLGLTAVIVIYTELQKTKIDPESTTNDQMVLPTSTDTPATVLPVVNVSSSTQILETVINVHPSLPLYRFVLLEQFPSGFYDYGFGTLVESMGVYAGSSTTPIQTIDVDLGGDIQSKLFEPTNINDDGYVDVMIKTQDYLGGANRQYELFVFSPHEKVFKKLYLSFVNPTIDAATKTITTREVFSGEENARAYTYKLDDSMPPRAVLVKQASNDPEILLIDKLTADTDKRIEAGRLHKSEKAFDYTQPYKPTLKIVYMDDTGGILKYEQRAGSDDSALYDNFYYDNAGALRYVRTAGGSVHGAEILHEIYFNDEGKRILEQHLHIKDWGQGYPKEWPDSWIIFDPAKEFK